MARQPISMRHVKEILRLKLQNELDAFVSAKIDEMNYLNKAYDCRAYEPGREKDGACTEKDARRDSWEISKRILEGARRTLVNKCAKDGI